MYTNISVDLAIRCVEDRWEEIKNYCTVPKELFIHMLKECIFTTVFQYGGEFYQQVGGTRNISKKLKCFQTVVALTNLRCLFLLQNMMVFLRSSVRERMNQHFLNLFFETF